MFFRYESPSEIYKRMNDRGTSIVEVGGHVASICDHGAILASKQDRDPTFALIPFLIGVLNSSEGHSHSRIFKTRMSMSGKGRFGDALCKDCLIPLCARGTKHPAPTPHRHSSGTGKCSYSNLYFCSVVSCTPPISY